MQKSRHHANRPRFYEGYPIVFDIDDADFIDPRMVDSVTECIEGSVAVIAGSEFVAQWCEQHNRQVHVVWTGTMLPPSRPRKRSSDRQPILAWASSAPHAQPWDLEDVTKLVLGLAARKVNFAFRIYGASDAGKLATNLARFTDANVDYSIYPKLSYKAFLESLQDVAVGLAPFSLDTPFNHGKSFGKVLAYLVSDIAIVASPVLEHPKFFCHGQNGMLPKTSEEWIECTDQLLSNPDQRQAITDHAWNDFERELSTDAAAKKVMRILEENLPT